MTADRLLDAFIDANLLLVLGYGAWLAVQRFLSPLSADRQLRLLHLSLAALLLAPFLGMALSGLTQRAPTLSDVMVAYYLGGGIGMRATDFDYLLSLRTEMTRDVMQGSGWIAQGMLALFAIGLCLGAARLLRSLFALRRILRTSFVWRRTRRVTVHLSDRIAVPFSACGLWRCHVVLPTHMLAQPEHLRVALAHEFQHLRAGDLKWELLLEMLRPLFLLNPVFHAFKRQLEGLREMRCDAAVLARGRIGRRAYCATLLEVSGAARRRRGMLVTAPQIALVPTRGARAVQVLERRVAHALARAPLRDRPGLFGLCAAVMLMATLATGMALQRPADWSQDRLIFETVINLERLDEINRTMGLGQRSY